MKSIFSDLITYDYILFGLIFFVFILLIVLTLLIRSKKKLAIFLVSFSFLFLFITPFIGHKTMHELLFKNKLTLVDQKKLQFTKAVVVYAKLKNISKRNFKSCFITISINRSSTNKFKNFIYQFKPINEMSIIKEDILIGEEIDFKTIISPFTYSNDYDVAMEANCR